MIKLIWNLYYKNLFKDKYEEKIVNAKLLKNSIQCFTTGRLANSRNQNGDIIRELVRSTIKKSDMRNPLVIKYSK